MEVGIVISMASVVIVINGGAIGLLWRQMNKNKDEFDKHKESVQYKDTCAEVVKRIDQSAQERHNATTDTLERIETLIKRNGYTTPRVQT